MVTEIDYQAIRAEKLRNSIIYGAIAGVVFSCVTWGFDSIRLALSHGVYPFAIFFLGIIPTVLLGIIVAYVVYRSQNLLVAFVLWVTTGVIFAWLAGHIPIDILSRFISLVNPDLARMVDYPFVIAAQFKTGLAMVVVVIMTLVAGMLEIALVDATSDSGAPIGRWLPAVLWIAFFFVAGLAPENNITASLTQPVINTDQSIQYAIDHAGQTLNLQSKLDYHVMSVSPLSNAWGHPRKVLLSRYDDLIYNTTVLVDFGNQWGTCSALDGWPSICELKDKSTLYLK